MFIPVAIYMRTCSCNLHRVHGADGDTLKPVACRVAYPSEVLAPEQHSFSKLFVVLESIPVCIPVPLTLPGESGVQVA